METNNETLASALSKAQSEFKSASLDGSNPHYKSRFSSYNELVHATREALGKYGISFIQYPDVVEGSHVLISKIKFNKEEEISMSPIILKDPTNSQELGKAISYISRYVMRTMLGIIATDEDDDGNESAGITANSKPADAISDKQLGMLRSILSEQPEREVGLLKYYKISDLSHLSWKHMQDVVTALKGKE